MAMPHQQLAQTLSGSISPDAATRRAAEEQLRQGEAHPGFLLLLLQLINDGSADAVARQTAGVYFKNAVKRLWAGEEDTQISEGDKQQVKAQIVAVMISLGTPQTARFQSQIGEAVSHIATLDFPDQWPGLIDELVNSLTPDNFVINNGVLATAHSIFSRWRSQFRSDKLYTAINLVLERFVEPYAKLFAHVDSLLATQPSPLLAEAMLLLVELLYDLNCQELAPFFEDNMAVFMGSVDGQQPGYLRKYLSWERPELSGDDDTPGPVQKIRASICEVAELFTTKYPEEFPQLGSFVETVWGMLTTVGPSQREDQLVSRALRFLSVVVKMGKLRDMFASQDTLRAFSEKIILPNMELREHEEEMFEDDPAEYIRRDLEPAIDSETRRQAATDFTRALMENFADEVTEIIKGYIQQYLQAYAADSSKWKSKDTAIYLLTSIASRGSTQALGVTSTNNLVDVVSFFGQNVYPDLSASGAHPILVVDAIKFLYTFRNQLTKEQLVSVLPALVQHLGSDNYVVYSYAAITIERVLFRKVERKPLFNEADIQPFAENILLALFASIERGATPEKIAENDYLMKCAMRVIITARASLAPAYEGILARLVAILGEISKNPSNPRFNQYCFESISALIRFVGENPATVSTFENALFGPAQAILAQDITEFVPYILQILAQLLELHPATGGLPASYSALTGPLLHSALWEQRGNVPALVRIWRPLLVRAGPAIAAAGQVQGLLGVFQRLMGSKANDAFGIEIVQSLYEVLPLDAMQQYSPTIFTLLLTRLNGGGSAHFKQGFVYFFCLLCALDSVGPDYVIQTLDGIQAGLFKGLFTGVIQPNTQKTTLKQRKVVAVGLVKLLTKSDAILNLPDVWAATLLAFIDMYTLAQDVNDTAGAQGDELDALDPEAFQAAFSRLGAAESKAADPLPEVQDVRRYASAELAGRARGRPGVLPGLMALARQAEGERVAAWEGYMQSNG